MPCSTELTRKGDPHGLWHDSWGRREVASGEGLLPTPALDRGVLEVEGALEVTELTCLLLQVTQRGPDGTEGSPQGHRTGAVAKLS